MELIDVMEECDHAMLIPSKSNDKLWWCWQCRIQFIWTNEGLELRR